MQLSNFNDACSKLIFSRCVEWWPGGLQQRLYFQLMNETSQYGMCLILDELGKELNAVEDETTKAWKLKGAV